MVTNDNVNIPPGICIVHVDDARSNIGPQKKPNPLKANKTINNLLIGGNVLLGQISPYLSS